MNALLALAASALWGTSDFGGGLISRRLNASAAVLISQALALAGLLVLLPFLHVATGPYMLTAATAGVVATLSLAAFYRAMATAPMSLVAPITAAALRIPVLVGMVRGEHLSVLQLAGIVVTLTGIVLASGPELRSGVAVRRQALCAVDRRGDRIRHRLHPARARGRSGLYGTLLCQRIGGLVVLGPIVLRGRLLRGIRPDRRAGSPPWPPWASATSSPTARTRWRPAAATCPIAAVLASLYPVVTALLARASCPSDCGRCRASESSPRSPACSCSAPSGQCRG